MLQPKRQKFRKAFDGRMRGVATQELSFGEFGLRAKEAGFLTSRQIESARKAMTHYTKRGGKIWIRVFPQNPVTQKAQGLKMGSGKGNVVSFGTPIKVGTIAFEMSGVTKEVAKEAFRLACNKLPFKLEFIEK